MKAWGLQQRFIWRVLIVTLIASVIVVPQAAAQPQDTDPSPDAILSTPAPDDPKEPETDWGWIALLTTGIASAAAIASGIMLVVDANAMSDDAAEQRALIPTAESLPPGVDPCDVAGPSCISVDYSLKWRDLHSNVAPFLLAIGSVGIATTVTLAIIMATSKTDKSTAKTDSGIELMPTVAPGAAGLSIGIRF
jgi:hypothetical protein